MLGFSLSESEKNKLIVKKIVEKAESASFDKDFLSALLEHFGCGLANRCYFFKGPKEEWKSFLEHKRTNNIDTFFVYTPEIQLKDFSSDGVDLILKPDGLFFLKGHWILFLFTYSAKPNSTYFPKFLFYYLCFQRYLDIKIKEFFIAWFDESGQIQISNYLPTVKKVTKNTLPDYLKISEVLGLKELKEDLPFEFVEGESRETDRCERKKEEIIEALELIKEEFPYRVWSLAQQSKKFLGQVPDDLEVVSDWHKKINWTNLLSVDSSELNHQTALRLKLFEPDSSVYRQVFKLLYPNCLILASSLVSFKEVFKVIRQVDPKSLPKIPNDDLFWDSFLSFAYSQYLGIPIPENNHLLSKAGFKRLQKELLEVEWKVYYDFESYSETLTQLSIQIFKGQNLYLKENLILEDTEDLDSFEREIILKLAIPILELNPNLNIETFDLLVKKIVYISFNKTFECEWLSRLFQKYKEKDKRVGLLADLIRLLTIDLSDWFRFSKNLSLNLIGPLEGGHSLKKLTKLVAKKQYSELDLVQEGRTAQLLYYYFYLSGDELDNKHLAPKTWIVKEKKPSILKEQLKEYCELDVENMVLAVNWLKEEYEKQKHCLVSQNDILSFISWFKGQRATVLSQLIKDYIGWKFR